MNRHADIIPESAPSLYGDKPPAYTFQDLQKEKLIAQNRPALKAAIEAGDLETVRAIQARNRAILGITRGF